MGAIQTALILIAGGQKPRPLPTDAYEVDLEVWRQTLGAIIEFERTGVSDEFSQRAKEHLVRQFERMKAPRSAGYQSQLPKIVRGE